MRHELQNVGPEFGIDVVSMLPQRYTSALKVATLRFQGFPFSICWSEWGCVYVFEHGEVVQRVAKEGSSRWAPLFANPHWRASLRPISPPTHGVV